MFMLVPAEGFAYTKGAPKTYRRLDKADAVTREFCAVCGTHMISRRPGLRPVVLKIGTLDDPSVYGGAQKAIFTAEGQPFHLIADGVPAFEGLPPRQVQINPVAGVGTLAVALGQQRNVAPRSLNVRSWHKADIALCTAHVRF